MRTKQDLEHEVQSNVTGTEKDDEYYKRDTFCQVYVDRRYLAEVMMGVELMTGRPIRSMSELVGDAVELLASILTTNERVEKVHLTKDATEMLRSRLKGSLNTHSKGERNLWYNMRLDDARLSKAGKLGEKTSHRDAPLKEVSKSIQEQDEQVYYDSLRKLGIDESNDGLKERARADMSESEVERLEREERERMKNELDPNNWREDSDED